MILTWDRSFIQHCDDNLIFESRNGNCNIYRVRMRKLNRKDSYQDVSVQVNSNFFSAFVDDVANILGCRCSGYHIIRQDDVEKVMFPAGEKITKITNDVIDLLCVQLLCGVVNISVSNLSISKNGYANSCIAVSKTKMFGRICKLYEDAVMDRIKTFVMQRVGFSHENVINRLRLLDTENGWSTSLLRRINSYN